MKIVTAGAGEVGYHLVENLSGEDIDMTVVDLDNEVLDKLSAEFNITTISGNIIDKHVLQTTQIKNADLFVAITNSDQTNMIACKMASELGAKRTICRIRQIEVSTKKKTISLKALGIDLIINPVSVVADEINRMVLFPNAVDQHEFFQGKVTLIGYKLTEQSGIVGKTMAEIESKLKLKKAQTGVMQRQNFTTLPTKDTVYEVGDVVYFFCPTSETRYLRKLLNYQTKKTKRVFINGGGQVGSMLAQQLERKEIEVKIIEHDLEQCQRLADKIDTSLVLNFEGTDIKTLQSEGIANADFFIAVTNNDKINLTSCLLVHQFNVKRTICLVKEKEYIPIIDSQTPITFGVSPRALTARYISKFIHGEKITSYFSIMNSQAEVLEIDISSTCPILHIPLKELHLPEGVLIGMILRQGQVILPTGKERLQIGDSILLSLHRFDRKPVIDLFFESKNYLSENR